MTTKAALIKAREALEFIKENYYPTTADQNRAIAKWIFTHDETIRDLLDKAIGGESKTGVGPMSTELRAPLKPAVCRECYRYLGDPVVCPGCMAYRDHQS